MLAGALLCYFVLAFGLITTKAPWVDEGWFGSASANWARTGSFGTPSLAPTGSWLTDELTGIERYTYWCLPIALVLQGVWFKLFGFSVFTMRLLGILFGALALISWSAVVTKVSGIRLAGPVTAALLAVDYTFLWGAADGRMDIMCLAFGSLGLASYLLLRESRWKLSLWLANTFIALAVFTHPNGLMPFLWLLFLLVVYDRRRLAWSDVTTTTPFLILAVLLGFHILQRPDYFLSQFAANANARGGSRLANLTHPLGAAIGSIRFALDHYGLHGHPLPPGPVPKYAILIPLIYGLVLPAGWMSSSMRRHPGRFALLCLASIQLCLMTFFIGLKLEMYLIFILPFCAALLAVGTSIAFANTSSIWWSSLVLAIVLVSCQLGTALSIVKADSYHRQYLPAMEFVRDRLGETTSPVIAGSYFGFDLGFARVQDDARLGFYSGMCPPLIVEDQFYSEWWARLFAIEEPELTVYVKNLLGTEYSLVFANRHYRVYERRKS